MTFSGVIIYIGLAFVVSALYFGGFIFLGNWLQAWFTQQGYTNPALVTAIIMLCFLGLTIVFAGLCVKFVRGE